MPRLVVISAAAQQMLRCSSRWFSLPPDHIDVSAGLDRGRHLEFHVLGQSGALEEGPGLVLHGGYERDSFVERVREIDPALGVVFSRWLETYCHTLTEMWACGLPVLATELGAVVARRAPWRRLQAPENLPEAV